MIKSIHLLSASAALALPAFAGDPTPPTISYEAQPEWTWTGFYAGIQAGVGFNPGDNGDMEFDSGPDGNYGDFIAAFGNNYDGSFNEGFVGGIHAGYDHQFGKFVLGGLIDINFADIGQRQSAFSATPAYYHEDREIDLLSSARIKLGYAVNDRFLVYFTGGLAYADVEYDYVTDTPAAVASGGGDSSQFGYVVGLGMEARVTRHLSLGLEYLYTNLGDSDFETNLSGPAAFSPVPGSSTNSRGSDRDFDFHMIQAKLTYRF